MTSWDVGFDFGIELFLCDRRLLAFENVDDIFGCFIDFDRFIDIVAEVVCCFDFPLWDFFDHCRELFVGVAAQYEAVVDTHRAGWFVDIEA